MDKEISPLEALNNLYEVTRNMRLTADEHAQVKKWGDLIHDALNTNTIIKSNGKKKKKFTKEEEEVIENYKDRKR